MKKIFTKKIATSIGALIIPIYAVNAQDLITKKTGEDLKVKVLEINNGDIKYKRFDNLNGPIYSMAKSDILMIRYENGSKDIFEQTSITNKIETPNMSNLITPKSIDSSLTKIDYEQQAKLDATYYYKKADGFLGGGCYLGVQLPIIALGYSIICSSAEPRYKNLQFPDAKLMENPVYRTTYMQYAYKKKKKNIWNGFFIGLISRVYLTYSNSSLPIWWPF